MDRSLKSLIVLVFIVVLIACRKEASPPPQRNPNEIVETEPPILRAVNTRINVVVGGFYEALPFRYNETTKKYPLLISFHGAGQFGNGTTDLPQILNEGVPKIISQKKFPPNFKVNGKNFSFIILMPQLSSYPPYGEVRSFIDYARTNYRVDLSRIYLTGYSIGGVLTCGMSAEYPTEFAAIVPMAGEIRPYDSTAEKCKNIANGGLPVWDFHCDNDLIYNVSEAYNFVSLINSYNPIVPPKLTILPSSGNAGHDAWTTPTDPAYRENNKNIYEWMLGYSR